MSEDLLTRDSQIISKIENCLIYVINEYGNTEVHSEPSNRVYIEPFEIRSGNPHTLKHVDKDMP